MGLWDEGESGRYIRVFRLGSECLRGVCEGLCRGLSGKRIGVGAVGVPFDVGGKRVSPLFVFGSWEKTPFCPFVPPYRRSFIHSRSSWLPNHNPSSTVDSRCGRVGRTTGVRPVTGWVRGVRPVTRVGCHSKFLPDERRLLTSFGFPTAPLWA